MKKFKLIPGKLYKSKREVDFFRHPFIDMNSSVESLKIYPGDVLFLLSIEFKKEIETSWLYGNKTIFQEYIINNNIEDWLEPF